MKWNDCRPCTPVPVTNQSAAATTEEGWAVQTSSSLFLVSSLVVTVAINTFKEYVFRYIFRAPNTIASCDIPASKEDVGTELSLSPEFLSLLWFHTGRLVVCHCLPFFLHCLLYHIPNFLQCLKHPLWRFVARASFLLPVWCGAVIPGAPLTASLGLLQRFLNCKSCSFFLDSCYVRECL